MSKSFYLLAILALCEVFPAFASAQSGSAESFARPASSSEQTLPFGMLERIQSKASESVPEEAASVRLLQQFSSVLKKADGTEITLLPLIAPKRVGKLDVIDACVLAVLPAQNSNKENVLSLVEMKPTGFAEDFEPCTALRPLITIDINSDGQDDAVFAATFRDATGKLYELAEVYLATNDSSVCHSSRASSLVPTLVRAKNPRRVIQKVIQQQRVLRGLGCE